MKKLDIKTVLALILWIVPLLSIAQQNGTTLTSDICTNPHWSILYGWTIDKSATPATWDLFAGDQGTSQYTIAVNKDNGTMEAWVYGVVCVTNGGAVATENLSINVELRNGYEAPNDSINTAIVDLSSNPVLDPGESNCYEYIVTIPITGGTYPQPHANGTYKATAHITITNHSGSLGIPTGPDPSATTVFPTTPDPKHNSIAVNDSNGGSWNFNESGSVAYNKTFTCNSDEGSHGNVASIIYTDDQTAGPSDDASVTVNCYALNISKTAATSLTRTYQWSIDKVADQTALMLSLGQVIPVTYIITVASTFTDSNWAATGMITLNNPAPIAATINSISDIVSPDIAATISFTETFPYTLAAGASLTGAYLVALPDANERMNTATATMQNYSYSYTLAATPIGTTDYVGTANVSFNNPTITNVDECITVTDSFAGNLGIICVGDSTNTFTYTREVGPFNICGDYTVDNTASFTTNDTGTTGNDSWAIPVNVPCLGGCTLTPGYWKTHSIFGPAPYDDTWLQIGENTIFFSSGKTYYQVLWTPPAGNAYYILAHAYIAARINILNGADQTAAIAALNEATILFTSYTPANVANLKGKARLGWTNLATILDNYNNGLIGPGHCTECTCDSPSLKSISSDSEYDMPLAQNQGLFNYPNPFSTITNFAFELTNDAYVTLSIYNLTGQEITKVFSGELTNGNHTIEWCAPDNMISGFYIYKLETIDFSKVQMMILKK